MQVSFYVVDPFLRYVVILISQKYRLISPTNFLIHFSFAFFYMVLKCGASMIKTILTSGKKDEIEKTHTFFCKNTLGVNKQCPNVAARNELGRLPLQLAIETAIIKFWIHLQNLPDKNIAKQCLQLLKEMADEEQPGLMQKIKTMCNKYSSTPITLNENNEKVFISHIKQNIQNALTEHQLSLLKTNRKLSFYMTFKSDTKKADFLDMIKNPRHRIAINKFRLGNHLLRIETDRTPSQRLLKT